MCAFFEFRLFSLQWPHTGARLCAYKEEFATESFIMQHQIASILSLRLDPTKRTTTMDCSLTIGSCVQVLDEDSVWCSAEVMQLEDNKYVVHYDGWSTLCDDTVTIDKIRQPVPKKLYERKRQPNRFSNPERLFAQRKVNALVDGIAKSVTVKENDPFNQTITTTEGTLISYYDLLKHKSISRFQQDNSPKKAHKKKIYPKKHEKTKRSMPETATKAKKWQFRSIQQKVQDQTGDETMYSVTLSSGKRICIGSFLKNEASGDIAMITRIKNKSRGLCIMYVACVDLKETFLFNTSNNESALEEFESRFDTEIVKIPVNASRRAMWTRVRALHCIAEDGELSDPARTATLGLFLRVEVNKALKFTGRGKTLSPFPPVISSDLRMLGLTSDNGYTETYYPDTFGALDYLLGPHWDFKRKGNRYVAVTFFRCWFNFRSGFIESSIKYVSSWTDWNQSYRRDVMAQLKGANNL